MALTNKGKRNELNNKGGFTRPSFFISRPPARPPCPSLSALLLLFLTQNPNTRNPRLGERASEPKARASSSGDGGGSSVGRQPNAIRAPLFRFARMRKGETSKRQRQRRWRLMVTAVFTCRWLVGSMTFP